MGMLSDMFCSSPASTATRKTHHHHDNSSTTPRLIRVLSSPCCSTNDVALNPNNPPAGSRHEYKQLLQRQSISSSSSSCYGADSATAMEQMRSGRRRSSSSRLPSLCTYPSSGASAAAGAEKTDSQKHKSTLASRYHGSNDKVVVLWVSLHCKGCEAKVRNHISKMEGVKYFSTDRISKRVTIISNMDPYDVLASVSTVKYAHFWPSSSSSSYYYSPSPSSSSSAALLTLTR